MSRKRAGELDETTGEPLVKQMEPKDVKFVRLANRRVPVAIKKLEYVANLFNRSSYAWTTEQADKIVRALVGAVKAVSDKAVGNKDNGTQFTL